ncbi:hypothetical protein ABY45_10360 [Microbacterium maritypicum]|uniref:hypothetical protein n=1 Tax=Microbacterium maritypicum TaxID=33918 RepID=UPI003D6ED43D
MAFGLGVAAVVLSSWLILLMRAVYREDEGFRSGRANATPLWMFGFTGVVALLISADWLVDWADHCLPADGWSGPGTVFIGLGLAVALTAIGRLIYNRARVATTGEPVDNGDENSPQSSSSGEAPATEHPRNFPVERRRVIIEYAITYGAAGLVIVIGTGLAWN